MPAASAVVAVMFPGTTTICVPGRCESEAKVLQIRETETLRSELSGMIRAIWP